MQINSYEKLNELRNKNETIFNIALGQIISNGYKSMLRITDDEIENCKIPMFSDELSKIYALQLREIAKVENNEPYSIYKFVQIEKPFTTVGFKPRGKKK